MTSEQITVSLEWAQKLKEARWPQGRTEHYYVYQRGDWDLYTDCNCDECWSRSSFRTKFDAPTAEEILRRLPRYLPWKDDSDNMAALFVSVFTSSYRVGYSPQWTQDAWSSPDAETLADAAAGCYCYLVENKLLSTCETTA